MGVNSLPVFLCVEVLKEASDDPFHHSGTLERAENLVPPTNNSEARSGATLQLWCLDGLSEFGATLLLVKGKL